MHCHSCEVLLEKSLEKLPHVKKAVARQRAGTVEISYDTDSPSSEAIEHAIVQCGYTVGKGGTAPWINPNTEDWIEIFGIAVALFIGYMVLHMSGVSLGDIGPG